MDISFIDDDDVHKYATFGLNERFDLYDERFGSIKSTSKCTTCGKTMGHCYGHYASLYLGVYIFHPMFFREIVDAVNTTCQHCHTIILPTGSGHVKSGRKCVTCGGTTYVDYNIFPMHAHLMKRRHGGHVLTPGQCRDILENRPDVRRYIISYIIVPPTGIRPPEEVEWPSEISRTYTMITDAVKNPGKGYKHLKRIQDLYNSIVGYIRKDGVIKAISGKQGIFRTLMLGKRLNRSARLVIVGDPQLELDEILVPYSLADGIRVTERVWNGNVDTMKRLAREGKVWWKSEDSPAFEDHIIMGKEYDRALDNGDIVVFNRQPSLSKFSLLAFKLRTSPDCQQNVFAFNPAITASFNADFDGDEMNIYAGYGLEAKAELMELCYITKNIYDPHTNKVYVHPIQDVITGAYLMTINPDQEVSRELYERCVVKTGHRTTIISNAANRLITTMDLIQMVMPEEWEPCVLTGKILCHDIILQMRDDERKLVRFIRNIQLVVLEWLNVRGLSIGLNDCAWKNTDELTDDMNKALDIAMKKTDGPLSNMVNSGSKGKHIGMAQMGTCIGKQYIGDKEIGYIKHGYVHGLDPKEYFYQASASLSGIVDIGTTVAAIGYANRRVSKLTADVVKNYNGTIGTSKQIIRF